MRALALVLIAGCEAMPVVQTDVTIPEIPELAGKDVELQVTWRDRNRRPQTGVAEVTAIDAAERRYRVTMNMGIGTSHLVEYRIWYDRDADKQLGPGDLMGEVPTPFVARDRGGGLGCGSRNHATPPVTLTVFK